MLDMHDRIIKRNWLVFYIRGSGIFFFCFYQAYQAYLADHVFLFLFGHNLALILELAALMGVI